MAIYVAMQPPAAGRGGGADGTVLVRDGFAWLAFLAPPLWLLWHRLWIEALLALVALGLLSALAETSGLGLAGSLLTLLVSLYIGLEGQALRLARLSRRGWHGVGTVEAGNPDEADIRYFARDAVEGAEAPLLAKIVPDPALARPPSTGMALGIAHTPARP